MKSIRQNPHLKVWGIIFFGISMYLSWQFGPILASFASIVALLVGATGIDTELIKDGIKLGFTKIVRPDIENVYDNGEGEIVIVTRGDRRFTVKRWHYKSTEWEPIQQHLVGLAQGPEQVVDGYSDPAA